MLSSRILLLLHLAASAAACSTALDCALSGDCIRGKCHCDVGWKNPEDGGTPCSALDLAPVDPQHVGYRNTSWPSWGGHPVFWPKDKGGDARWHLFTPQFANKCNVDNWVKNSFVVHAVADRPNGPWNHHDVAIPVWAHGPQAVVAPDGTWLLYFVGGWHYPVDEWADCTADNRSIAWWPVEPKSKGWPGTEDGCGPTTNAGCGIRVAVSHAGPFGPWTIQNVSFASPVKGPTRSKALSCARSDPAPAMLPNGTVFIAFGSGGCVGGLETIGVARAETWDDTYFFTSPDPIADSGKMGCPTGQLAEDPNMWYDGKRGFHIIAHGLCSWHMPGRDNMTDLYALHAFSEDGATWNLATTPKTGLPSLPWSKEVRWSNGSTTYASRMERPQVILDETATRPLYLTTAVCPGGDTVGGAACHFTIPSWNLYRPLVGTEKEEAEKEEQEEEEASAAAEAEQSLDRPAEQMVGRLPPLGWSTWTTCGDASCTHDFCNEAEVKAAALAMKENGMQALGFDHVILDDCWAAEARNATSQALTWDKERFPSGIPQLVAWLTERGFRLGLYTSAGNQTCSSGGRPHAIPGSRAHYNADATAFAEWNISYVKLDWCGDIKKQILQGADAHRDFAAALKRTGAEIFLETVAGFFFLGTEVASIANAWRFCEDHHDTWSSTTEAITCRVDQKVDALTSGPGGWAYNDVLQTGGAGCIKDGTVQAHCPGQTDGEYRVEFATWLITQSPLIVSTDVREMTPVMRQLLLNKELLQIHQSVDTPPGKRLSNWLCSEPLHCDVWARHLGGENAVLVALVNTGDQAHRIEVKWSAFGWESGGVATVRDMLAGDALPDASGGSFGARVQSHDAAIFRLQRTNQ